MAKADPYGPSAMLAFEKWLQGLSAESPAAPYRIDDEHLRTLWQIAIAAIKRGASLPFFCAQVLAMHMAEMTRDTTKAEASKRIREPRGRGAPRGARYRSPMERAKETMLLRKPLPEARGGKRIGDKSPLELQADELHKSKRTLSRRRQAFKKTPK